jgi:AAA domain (dynein-related subfamily)
MTTTDPRSFTLSEAADLMAFLGTFPTPQPNVRLIGPPGIGKTAIVTQAVTALGRAINTYTPALMVPEDIGGMCVPDQGLMTFLLSPVVRKAWDTYAGKPLAAKAVIAYANGTVSGLDIQGSKQVTIFLDEFDKAPRALQSTFLSALQEGQINGWHFPPGTNFILAVNETTDGSDSNGVPSTVTSRRMANVTIKPDLDEWLAYMDTQPKGVHTYVRFALKANTDIFARSPSFEEVERGEPFPCPRQWSEVSHMLHMMADIATTTPASPRALPMPDAPPEAHARMAKLVATFVGHKAATTFTQGISDLSRMVRPSDVFAGKNPPVAQHMQIALAQACARKTTLVGEYTHAVAYFEALGETALTAYLTPVAAMSSGPKLNQALAKSAAKRLSEVKNSAAPF